MMLKEKKKVVEKHRIKLKIDGRQTDMDEVDVHLPVNAKIKV